MKRQIDNCLVCLFLLLTLNLGAEAQNNSFGNWFAQARSGRKAQKVVPVSLSPKTAKSKLILNNKNITNQGVFYDINPSVLAGLLTNPLSEMDISLPQPDGSQVELQLIRVALTTPDFKISTEKQSRLNIKTGVHYRGIVKGSKKSLVSVSIFHDEMVAIVNEGNRNRVLGKMKDESLHVFYNEDLLNSQFSFQCAEPTGPTAAFGTLKSTIEEAQTDTSCKVVRLYFEVDYKMFTDLGANASAAASFVLGMFNQVATIYRNDDIYLQISGIKIWTSPDPYVPYADFDNTWNAFRDQLNGNFNGDIAHLLSTKNYVGGGKIGRAQFGPITDDCTIAGVNSTLCDKSQSVCFSFIYANYQNYPTYNWTVNVVAHETGHNLGSPHTHNCRWPGGPIDGCSAAEETFSCPGCVNGPTPPAGGGTVMSYCHQNPAVGINLANGFGALPAAKIRTEIQEAACLLTSSGVPTFLASDTITSTSAQLSWIPGLCCGEFVVEYRVGTSGSFIVADTTASLNFMLTGLSAATFYQWRVKSLCFGSYSATAGFTTPATGCMPTYSVNNCEGGTGISSFVLNRQTLSFQSDCGVNNYSIFQNAVPILKKGATYHYSVAPLSATVTQKVHIWIDSNKNGAFEGGELVVSSALTTGQLAGNITIPLTASSGMTYLRIRTLTTNQTANACSHYFSAGETEDYLIHIVADTTYTAVSLLAAPTLCIGQTIQIPFAATGTFTGGNTFTAQLSDSVGSFATPTVIGSVSDTISGSITATIPEVTQAAGYRIRVISSTPGATFLANNGHDLVLETCRVTISSNVSHLAVNYHSTPVHASAALDVQTSNKAFLLPRLTQNQISAINQPTAGSIVFDNTHSCIRLYNGTDWRCLSKNPIFTGAPVNTGFAQPTAQSSNARLAAASYCIPPTSAGCSDDDGLDNVIINGITLSSNTGCGSINGYSFYPTPVINLTKGQTYPFSITTLFFPQGISMWLDANKDTTFSHTAERLFRTPTASPTDGTLTGNITIPITASSGLMRLRIRSAYFEDYDTTLNACAYYFYSETEDYVVNILDPGVYTFTDLGGKADVCLGQAFTIPFTSPSTFAGGNVFTAQLSDASGSFASPTVLGSITGTVASPIAGIIPGNIPPGSGYKIRVISSNPVTTVSTPNSDTLTISGCNAVISQTTQGMAINYDGSDIHASAAMELKVFNKAFLLPRLTSAQISALPSPAAGLLLYNLTLHCLQIYDGVQWGCLLTETVPSPIVKIPQSTASAGVVSQSLSNQSGLILSESGVGMINSAAIAEIRGNRGVLLPRLKTLQRKALPTPTAGMLIYNSEDAALEYFDGTGWRTIIK